MLIGVIEPSEIGSDRGRVEAHIQLRTAISAASGILQSPSIEFGEDSDSVLVENLLASVSQHQRQKNGEQTRNRMRARTSAGYWCFPAPVGYRFEKIEGHGKLLVPDEPAATILRHPMYFEARHVDTLSFIGDAYRDDIEIEGGCLRDECAELYYGPDAELPEEDQANL